jgi:hypothetical protein
MRGEELVHGRRVGFHEPAAQLQGENVPNVIPEQGQTHFILQDRLVEQALVVEDEYQE